MSESDVTKGKKRRRRTATVHFYENMNKPSRARSETLAELRRDDAESVAEPDEVKGTMGNAHQPDGRNLTAARVSPSRVQGNAARAVDDHGGVADPMNPMGPKALALGHPDMRQGTTGPVPLLSMRTDANPHPRDLSGAAGVSIALSRLDAYGAAGAPGFREQPTGNPAMRTSPHIAPIGPSNGSHSLDAPACPPTMAMKNSDRVVGCPEASGQSIH